MHCYLVGGIWATSPEMSWLVHTIPERDDCEDALEYCNQGLVDVYDPPMGRDLVSGVDESDNGYAYFDENNN